MTKRQLWVEGYADKRLVQSVQRHAGLSGLFEVKFPGEKPARSGKSSALKIFETLLGESDEPGRYESIGVCVDADFAPEGSFATTDADLAALMARQGYRMTDAAKRLYKHHSSGCKASYWIAPSHAADGYLETGCISALAHGERSFLNSVVQPYVAGIQEPRFVARNMDRALMYVYLGVQKKPDKSMATLLDDGLADISTPPIAQLADWMKDLYS